MQSRTLSAKKLPSKSPQSSDNIDRHIPSFLINLRILCKNRLYLARLAQRTPNGQVPSGYWPRSLRNPFRHPIFTVFTGSTGRPNLSSRTLNRAGTSMKTLKLNSEVSIFYGSHRPPHIATTAVSAVRRLSDTN